MRWDRRKWKSEESAVNLDDWQLLLICFYGNISWIKTKVVESSSAPSQVHCLYLTAAGAPGSQHEGNHGDSHLLTTAIVGWAGLKTSFAPSRRVKAVALVQSGPGCTAGLSLGWTQVPNRTQVPDWTLVLDHTQVLDQTQVGLALLQWRQLMTSQFIVMFLQTQPTPPPSSPPSNNYK